MPRTLTEPPPTMSVHAAPPLRDTRATVRGARPRPRGGGSAGCRSSSRRLRPCLPSEPLPVEEPLLEEEPLALGSQLAEEDTDPVPVPLAVAVCAGLDEDRELAVAEGDAVPEADAEALGVQPTPLNTPTISTVEPNSARRLCAACWAAPGPGGAAGTKSTMASRRRSLGGEDSGLGREEKPEVEAAWGGKGPMVGLRAEASKVCEKEPCKPI